MDPAPEHRAKIYYRIQCGTLVYGGVSSAVLSLIPSLVKAAVAWKSVAPEMVLWGHLYFVLPLIDIMLTYPTICFALQVSSAACNAIDSSDPSGPGPRSRRTPPRCVSMPPQAVPDRRSSLIPTSRYTPSGALYPWLASCTLRCAANTTLGCWFHPLAI